MSRGAEPLHAPRTPRVPFAVLAAGLIVGGLALLLALNTASAANELRRRDLADKDGAAAAQVQVMRNRVAASAAPGNLAQAARELGMVPATKPAFLVVGADGKVRVMGSPGAAQGVVLAPAHPKKKHKPKPSRSTSSTASSTSTARSTTSPTSRSATSSAGSAKSSRPPSKPSKPSTPSTPSTASSPTPTPTPTLTLPGGER